MTKASFGFIVAGGLLYIVANQTQIGWLYLLDAIIWSLLVLSVVLPWYNLKSLQVEHQVLVPAPTLRQPLLGGPMEDEAVEVKLKVTNNGRLAGYFIKVLMDCPFEQPEKQHRAFLVPILSPRSATTFSYMAACYRRGHYAALSATLQSSGPLGLITRRRIVDLPLNLTVYPTYYQMEGLPVSEPAWADWGHAVRNSAAADFYGSKEYQHGDPLKHIHWRNTARLGTFMIKEFEQTSHGSVTVAFETSHNFGIGKETTLEYSIKIAASLAKLCADSGHSIDIITGTTYLNKAGWRGAMDYLAHLEVEVGSALAEWMATPAPDQVAVVIVPTIETKLIPILSQLIDRVRGIVLVLLEGFSPDEVPHEFLGKLKGGNLEIISCSQGNLALAIKNLGDSLFLAGKVPASMG
ncbi:DUF58 domain-containing protein [Chloroflexota bacterium]